MSYEGIALQVKVKFETIECFTCHVLFAVESQTRQHYLDTGDSFYCPNGHRQHYIDCTIEALKSKLAKSERFLKNSKKRTEWAEQDAKNAREGEKQAKNSLRSEKGAKTKLKKRIANGVCPCCQRTFANLAKHMTGQHPDYGKQK